MEGVRTMSTTAGSGVEVAAIDTPALGDRSYLAHDGDVAVVVDPQRDIDRVLDLAAARGVRITHVFETHLHNDYVTGGLALARATGAAYHVNAADPVAFDRVPVKDGDVIEVSPVLRVQVLATPGHTFTHLSYVLEAGGRAHAVFTGGSLLYGSTGRPDLLGRAHADELARAQFASAHRLAAELPRGRGRVSHPRVRQLLLGHPVRGHLLDHRPGAAGQPGAAARARTSTCVSCWPAWTPSPPTTRTWARPTPPGRPGPTCPRRSGADAAELRRRIEAGEWVVDLRARRAFAAGHVAGTLSFDLDGSFATYLGWLIPWGTPLTLLGHTPEQVAEAQRELTRIGIDRPAAAAVGRPGDWAGGRALRSYPVADFADLEAVRQHRPVVILDVRRDSEWAASHIAGAVHIPIHQLPSRLADVPAGEIWVHCEAGYRASVAASFLDAAGHTVVAVDDEYERAARVSLPLDGPLAHAAAT